MQAGNLALNYIRKYLSDKFIRIFKNIYKDTISIREMVNIGCTMSYWKIPNDF